MTQQQADRIDAYRRAGGTVVHITALAFPRPDGQIVAVDVGWPNIDPITREPLITRHVIGADGRPA